MLKADPRLRQVFIRIVVIINDCLLIVSMWEERQVSSWQLTNYIICNSIIKRLRGLYFRNEKSMCLIYPCNCIHTFFFRRKIDVAFIDKNKSVVRIFVGLKPWRVLICKNSFYVAEKFSCNDSKFLSLGDKIII